MCDFLTFQYSNPIHPTVLFVGGGSVGHIAPSVAVWEAVQDIDPDAKAHFVCANRQDDILYLQKNNLEYTAIEGPRLSLGFPWKFLQAWRASKKILNQVQPDIIFSKGGYVSVPVCLAAYRKKIPIILHESDAILGRANTFIARFANHICFGIQNNKANCQLPTANCHYSGNPVRQSISNGSEEEGLQITQFSGDKPILLVSGGSQGAEDINQIIIDLLPELMKEYDVIHICGRGKSHAERSDAYWWTEFADEELKHLYAISDVAIARAGAGSIAELEANSIPSVLVPLENVPHAHQADNARLASQSNLFTMLKQSNLKQQLLYALSELQQPVNELTSKQVNNLSPAKTISHLILKTLDPNSLA